MESILNITQGAAGGIGGSSFGLIFIIAIGGLIFYFFYKKKKNNEQGSIPQQRHEGDEVWKTIKDFLRDNNEKGKQIVDTYVAKRPNPDVIDKTLSKEQQKLQKAEIEKRKKEKKLENKKLKAEGKKPKAEKERELYVVLFTTRNGKTLAVDNPRAIECEVKHVRIDKKNSERKIVILGERNYEEEAKWILPLKEAEEAKLKKELERREKRSNLNPIKKLNSKVKNNKKDKSKRKEKDKWAKKEVVTK